MALIEGGGWFLVGWLETGQVAGREGLIFTLYSFDWCPHVSDPCRVGDSVSMKTDLRSFVDCR
jgi:hypothetical protein